MATIDHVPLFIDRRDGSSALMKYGVLAAHAEICTLDFGDVMIVGNGPSDSTRLVGVEVKSIWDLISSIDTGRLQATQLPGLVRTYDHPILLYYGQTRMGRGGELEMFREHGKKSGWQVFKLGDRAVPYGYLEAMLWDVSMYGVQHIQHVGDEATAAAWLGMLHRWWSKKWEAHKGLKVLDRSRDVSLGLGLDARTLQRVKVATQLPGIGIDRAQLAAEHFESVRAMVNASAADWSNIHGIGKVIGKAVEEAVK